jgi:peptidoglycan/LPS O-acetylase OafA/YrhL
MRPPYVFTDLLIALFLGWLLLPSPDIRGWGETHQLNSPSWSLLQEYLANILYGLFVRKFSKKLLWFLVIISALALAWVANRRGDVGTGWSYETFWIAVIRMMFPFFAGLLLFRCGKRIRIPRAFLVCSLLLALTFFMPYMQHYNGLYEAGAIILIFPLIVAMGAGGKVTGIWKRICRFSGDISYPIYITHFPFIYVFTNWIAEKKPAPAQIIPVAIGLFFFFVLLAYMALKWYDEPVQTWLKRRFSNG